MGGGTAKAGANFLTLISMFRQHKIITSLKCRTELHRDLSMYIIITPSHIVWPGSFLGGPP